jgi:glycosyltransferase involved in cell wall biosynthesis
MPRIAFLLGSTSSNGGIERVTSLIADEFIKKGIQVHAIGYQPFEIEKRVYKWNSEVCFFDLLKNKESMKTGIFKAIPRLRRYLNNNNIEILIACGHVYAPLAGLAAFSLKTKTVYWSHSSLFGEEVRAFKKLNEQFGSFLVNTVISLTKTDELNYKKKTLASNVVQIYNPVDKNLLLNTSPYEPDTKKIISVGRLDDQKQFHTHLLDVAEIVLKNNPEYTWHIYGRGALEGQIRKKINMLGLNGRVILEGNVTNLYELYSNYSIMVMTSAYEGFPMTLLEGLAKKIPLISFDVQTGPNEIIIDGVNGFLIPAFNCQQMANKIEILIQKKTKRISFSKANETLVEQFKIDKIMDKWVTLINTLVMVKK